MEVDNKNIQKDDRSEGIITSGTPSSGEMSAFVYGNQDEQFARLNQENYDIETARLRKEHIGNKYRQQHCFFYVQARVNHDWITTALYERILPKQLIDFLKDHAEIHTINAQTPNQKLKSEQKPVHITLGNDAPTTLPMILSSLNRNRLYEDTLDPSDLRVPLQMKRIWDFVGEYENNPSVLYSLRTKSGAFPSRNSRGMTVAYIRSMMTFLSFGDRRLKMQSGLGKYVAVPLFEIAKNAGYLEDYVKHVKHVCQVTGEITTESKKCTRINSSFKRWAERFNATYTVSVQNKSHQLFDQSINSGEAQYQAAERWLHDGFISDLLLADSSLLSEKELTDLFKAGRKLDKKREAVSLAKRIRLYEKQFEVAISPALLKTIRVKRKEYADKIRNFFSMSESVVADMATILYVPIANMELVTEIRRSKFLPDYMLTKPKIPT